MRYLVFIFKGFITRTINIYYGKIMNSKGIRNQVQNKVLPGCRALTAGVLTVPDLSVWVLVHWCEPVFPPPCTRVGACVCSGVCMCTGTVGVGRGGSSGACPSGTLHPQGCTLSVLFLLPFCVPTSGFLKPLLWHMGHVQFFTPLIVLKGTFTHLNLYLFRIGL